MADKIIYWLLLLFMPALVFSSSAAEGIHLLLFLLWIVSIISTKGYKFKRSPLDIPVTIFLCVQLVSILFSVDAKMSLRGISKLMPLTLFFILNNNLRTSGQLKKMADWFLISILLAASYGLGKYVLGLEDRISSTSGGYSTMASLLYIGGLFALSFGIEEEKKKFRWMYYAMALFLFLGLVFTFHRIHWIASFTGVIFLVLMKKPRLLLPVFLFLVIGVLLMPGNVRERFRSIFVRQGNWSSDRIVLWKTAAVLFPKSPFIGFGLKTFPRVFPASARELCVDKEIGSWHNEYVQILMESGLLGLLGYLGIIGVVFLNGVRFLRRKAKSRESSALGYGILAAFLSYLVIGLAGTNYQDPIHSRLMYTFLAGFFVLERLKNRGDGRE